MFNFKQSNFIKLFQVIIFASFFESTWADKAEKGSDESIPMVARIIFAVIFIPLGLAIALIGYKLIRMIKFFVGAFLFSGLTMVIAHFIFNENDKITDAQSIGILVGLVLAAIIGGILAGCVEAFSKVVLGAYLGLAIGLAVISTGVSLPNYAKVIIILSFMIGGESTAFFFPKFIDRIATAVTGSNLFINGVDLVARVGYSDFLLSFTNKHKAQASNSIWGMLAGFVAIAFIGYGIQQYLQNQDDENSLYRKTEPKHQA